MVRTYQRNFTNSRYGKNYRLYQSYSVEDLHTDMTLRLKEVVENENAEI